MLEQYGIHILWFVMSCCFGTWMYLRGALKGTTAGINAAVIFLVLNGREDDATKFLDFINNIISKTPSIDK